MLDQDFCAYLEYELTKAFANSPDQQIAYFWCDGILPPSVEQASKKYVNDKREISTGSFIGLDGQDRYELTLKFGPKSLSRYARSLDLKECIPDVAEDGWYSVDPARKKLIIQLL